MQQIFYTKFKQLYADDHDSALKHLGTTNFGTLIHSF